jgi:alanine-glyoxylate transaminase/serine-glyoxylate transaminase/serine-pyruvate transaminase
MFQTAARFLAKTQRHTTSLAASRQVLRTFSSTPSFLAAAEKNDPLSYDVVPKEDFGRYKEYSVIHTNRSLNLMSDPFQKVMRDLNTLLKATYNAEKVAIIPGSGTFGMEAVARQFATNEQVLVIRNGWFSYRWTEIFEMGDIPKSHTVLKAKPVDPSVGQENYQYAPCPVDEVVAKIYEERPATLFCAHVETSTGMILPDDYIRKVSAAMHDVGGLLVLDCIASGAIWADMKDLGADVVISAPQKGWTGPCCAALVMMSDNAVQKMETTKETSFAVSLKRWTAIMDTYVAGGFGYHTTMPTDALRDFHEISVETLKVGLPELKEAQYKLGRDARAALDERGLTSIAAPGFQAPGVLVYHSPSSTENPEMMTKFKKGALQIAMGVPWKLDEPEGMKTFRLGLFGLDKMGDIDGTIDTLTAALDPILVETGHTIPDSKIAV